MFKSFKLKEWILKKQTVFLIIDVLLVCIGIMLLLYRVLFGIDFTDQSWYVAEPYVVSEGAIPYANNWSQAPGFTIPLALFTKLYTFFAGGTEGIFLFSRIQYVIWLVLIGWVIYFFINQGNRIEKIPIVMLLPFLFITPYQLFSINYNTIGIVYLLLACVIVFADYKGLNAKGQFVSGTISGLIMARAVIGTPYVILPCAILAVLLYYAKEWKRLQGFISGGIIMTVLVVGWCCVRAGGVYKFINGLRYWLNDCAYFKMEGLDSPIENYIELFSYLKIFILCLVIAYISRKIIKTDASFEKFLYTMLFVVLIAACFRYLYTNNFKILTYWGWFEPVVLYLFLPDSERRKRIGLVAFIIVLYSSAFIFSSFRNVYGFGSREYWLYIPLFFSVTTIFSRNMETIKTNISFRVAVIILSLLMIRQSYCYVYRDESIKNLTTKVESGVWKGLYTTKERALAVVELEDYIKKITEKDDNVLFMDWSSFGYLMSNGRACTSTAYDAMQYSYNVNNSKVMYDYFNLTDMVPDKIIYVDFGRDDILSIETDYWEFNQFVNNNYNLQSASKLKMFRVMCYKLNDKEKAMEMSKEFMN